MQAADQPLMPPAANLNAVLGNLAGSAASKAIFKRMPGQGAAHSPRAVGARPAGTTAIAAAHASTCTSGANAVSRFATSASITSPWRSAPPAGSGTAHQPPPRSAAAARTVPPPAAHPAASPAPGPPRSPPAPGPGRGQSSTSRSHRTSTTSPGDLFHTTPPDPANLSHGQRPARQWQPTTPGPPLHPHNNPCAKDGSSPLPPHRQAGGRSRVRSLRGNQRCDIRAPPEPAKRPATPARSQQVIERRDRQPRPDDPDMRGDDPGESLLEGRP